MPEDSSDIAVKFTRGGDSFRLWRVEARALATKQDAEREGKPQEEIDRAVQGAIRAGVHAELNRDIKSTSVIVLSFLFKQQQRNVLEYLTAVCEAALRGEAVPSLLPASA